MKATFKTTDGDTVTDTGFSFSLGVGSGLLEVTFIGGKDTLFGHGFVGCSSNGCGTPGLYGEVTLRNQNLSRPDFESVFSFEQPASLQYMFFDGRNGLTTLLYLINNNVTSSTVAIDIRNYDDQLVSTVNLTFRPLESQLLTLHVLASKTIGIQGTLVIRGQNSSGAAITATGLRINPTNSFTPLRAFVPAP